MIGSINLFRIAVNSRLPARIIYLAQNKKTVFRIARSEFDPIRLVASHLRPRAGRRRDQRRPTAVTLGLDQSLAGRFKRLSFESAALLVIPRVPGNSAGPDRLEDFAGRERQDVINKPRARHGPQILVTITRSRPVELGELRPPFGGEGVSRQWR